MISSDNRRYAYGKSQLIEVICQLRFPTILSIDTREPADFQETVRAAFPRYQCQVEKLPGVNGAPARTVNNHTFISEDGGYKLSLTKDFIALSTMRYTHWEDFAARLDEPLGQFIKIYRPNCFDRVGLRFVNAISRDVERKLDALAALKLHAGPGFVQRNIRSGNQVQQVQEKEVRFIFDQDVYSTGKVKVAAVAETLNALHAHSDSVFSDAITTVLHDAMEPEYL